MKNGSALSAYFTHSGNTRVIAKLIHSLAGGDLVEIIPVVPYPADYDEVVEQARKELESDYRPFLKTRLPDMNPYTVVFIGYPNWWGTVPRPVAAFLSGSDLAGKAIAPFCTHEGSGLGRSVAEIRKLCPRSAVLDGLAVRGGDVQDAGDAVVGWLHGLGIGF